MLTQLIKYFPLLLLGLWSSQALHAQSAGETACYITGQISTTAVTASAFAVCLQSGNPAACAIGYRLLECAENPACDQVVGQLAEWTCNYTITKVGEYYTIHVEASRSFAKDLEQTYQSMNTVEGIRWLQLYLSR